MRLALIASIAFAVGCGGADETPLGGPFGGTTGTPPPASNADAGSKSPAGTGSPDAGPAKADAGVSRAGGDSGSTGTKAGAPTWTFIYTTYLTGSSTLGTCGRSGCHSEMKGSASSAWTWLDGRGYAGANLVGANSCLAWFSGGNMPLGYTGAGTKLEASAVADMNAWAAAGALEN